ncbi:uncharacterized protein LOC130635586 [Hydractinia symbiolongicarpus]|uniref:uncharacterized protein LOC130635586 n=1 Tax=Hydractinia symbiolongicarpus TaxID=13093 RepID=UPI00254DAE29|nr:uncharacterized protein LOC130635586 [Hydractinia symbiolongicarpus]
MITSALLTTKLTWLTRKYVSGRATTALDDILEPFFKNGLTNYSCEKNKNIIATVMVEHNIKCSKKIKTWIDQRKRKETRRIKKLDIHTTSECYNSVKDPNTMPIPKDVTPLKLERWKYYLKNCPLQDASWVLDGISNGFSLNCNPLKLISAKKNLASAYSHSSIIDDYLKNELEFGTISGPYIDPPFDNVHINRFGVIPKSLGKWRMITDLSFPVGGSVNDGVSFENYTVSYVGLSAAIKKILKFNQGCLMAKFDLQRAYRLLPIKENERNLLVFKWNGFYYVDLALPFGARSAPRIFTRFSNVLEWIFMTCGSVRDMQHSLDDFFICGPKKESVCQDGLTACFEICEELGVNIEHSKTEGPSTQIQYLGLIIDTDVMEIRVPVDKLGKIRLLLDEWLTKGFGSKRALLSLIGSLYYCCQAVIHGRPFLEQLVRRAYSVEQLHHKVVLTKRELEDVRWWFYLLNTWNGRSLLNDLTHNKHIVQLHS